MADGTSGVTVTAARIEGPALVLALQPTLDAIEAARLRIEAHLAPAGLAPRVTNRLEVVLEELIANVARHGQGATAILLSVEIDEDRLVLRLEDDAQAFNPLDVAEPTPFERLETAQVGGLGVAAVRRFASALSYAQSPDSRLWAEMIAADGRPINRLTVTLPTAI